jgi:hypothetical protein
MPRLGPLAGAATIAMCLAGCAGDGSGGVMASIFGPSEAATARSGTRPSADDEPMTQFERRRLMARLRQDPRTINRLTPRERREVAAMVKSVDEDDERD